MFDGLFEFCQLSAGGSVGKITNPVNFLFSPSADVFHVVLSLWSYF